MKKLLGPLLAVFAGVAVALSVALPAYADAVSDAVSHLNASDPVYRASDASVRLDSSAADGSKVNVAVAALPASAGDPTDAAKQIGSRVFSDRPGVVVVISGVKAGFKTDINGARNAINAAGAKALQDHPLKPGGDATPFVKELVSGINAAAPKGDSSAQPEKKGSSHTGLIVFLVIVAVVLGGVGAFVFRRRRHKQQHLADRRADVISYYDRLGADVQNLDAGTDPVARQALADAAERYTATGSQLEQAQSDAQFDAARRTALEGLQAAQTARRRLGLDPGPELPPLTAQQGDRLTEEQEIKVGDRTVRGYPEYTPGAPHYFPGGGGYGAGWYSFPFWETLLVGSVLSGGFGGWGGGGYESGFDSGYERGFDAGADQAQDANQGQDWGSGGDWGSNSGGGDWGGDSGGGDWGGGGDDGGGW